MKLVLLIAVLVLSPLIAAGQARTAEAIVDVPFSRLNDGNPRNGSVRHVINGMEGTTPCASGGTGALAIRINGVWECPKLTPGVGSGNVLGPVSSAVGELVLFNNTTGTNIGRSNSLSGIPLLTSGVVSVLASTGTGSVARAIGPSITGVNATNIFSTGTIPPARIISGTPINQRCLRLSNTGQIEVAANDCGTGSGGSPGGVPGNLTFNEAGTFGGIANSSYDGITGKLTLNQLSNSNDTLFSQRATDSAPTGSFLRLRNAANNTDLFIVAADATVFLSNALTAKNITGPATPSAGNTVVWTDLTTKNLRAQDDAGNVSGTVRSITCSGTDKVSAISSAGIVTCSADQTSGGGSGITTLNTLTASAQTFSKVDDTNVTLTITSTTSDHEFALGWTGRLDAARQDINTVHDDTANTWTTGAQSFAAATSLTIPTAAGAAPTASGQFAFDTTSNTAEIGVNGANRILAFTASSQTFTDKTLDSSNTVNLRDTLFTLQDNTDSTKTVNFELGGITSGTNRVVTVANAASVTVIPSTLTSNQVVTHIDSTGTQQKAQLAFSNLTGSLGPTQGGTGQTSVAQGDLLFGDAANSWARLPKTTLATRVLCNTGASNNPAWCQVELTNAVTGILPSGNGGTGNAFFAVSGPATSTKTFTFPNASATVLTDNAAVTIAQGGTGATTQTAAFNALDPLTTKGDVLAHDGTNSIRVPVGTNGQGLVADSTVSAGVKWATFSAAAGGSTTQLQRNNAGALGGISGATSDGVDVTFGPGNLIVGSTASAPTPSLGRFYVDTDGPALFFGIDGSDWGEVYVAGLSTFNLATDVGSSVLPLANGGTNQTAWTAARCVRVNAGGTALEAAAADCGTGGSGSPGGSDTQVQFNDASAFGGDAGLTYNKTTDALTVAGSIAVSGSGAGNAELAEGTAPSAVGNRVTLSAPTDVQTAGWVLSLPTTPGTTGQFLQTNGSGVTSWATPGGSGTVTATGGALTANAIVLGAGTTDTKVVAGITTNGAARIKLGVAGSVEGVVEFFNQTSGSVIITAPPTGALGTAELTLPVRTATIATTIGMLTSGRCVEIDASGNFIQAAAACGSGGGGSPGGSGTELQYRGGASTFSAVTDSSVSGGTVVLGHTAALGRLGETFEVTTGANYGGVSLNTFSSTVDESAILDFNRSKSATKGTHTVVAANDHVGQIFFRGSDGVNFHNAAAIKGSVDGTAGLNNMPGRLSFYTTPVSTTALTERWRMNNAGHFLAVADGAYDIGATGENRPRDIFVTGAFAGQGTGAGYLEMAEGTAPSLATNRFQIHAPADVAAGGLSFILPAAGATGFLKTTNASGAMTLSIDTATYETAASTATFTNKTYDTEGTGNAFLSSHKVFLPAAGCDNGTTAASFWDATATTPAVPACVVGTVVSKGVLDFADTSGGFTRQITLQLPADFAGTIDAKILWTTTATSGNVEFSLATICTATDGTATDDPGAFNTASTVVTAAPGVANRVQTSSITSLTITGCDANDLLHVRVFRDGNDAQDTLTATVRFIGLELTMRRAQ